MTVAEWLAQEPFSIALSSSFFGFFAHCGAVAALEERGLRPSRASGASAGAVVAAGLASGMTSDEMREIFVSVRREDFWDPRPGPGLLAGRKFRALLERHFAPTFADAKIPVEVAAVDLFRMRTKFLEEGSLPDAVYASCAVPLMFFPIRLHGRIWVDGGVMCKSGFNPARSGERSLCVLIPAKGWTGVYERRFNADPLGNNALLLRLENLPRVGPDRLEVGSAAFAAAYAETARRLDAPAAPMLRARAV